MRDFSKRLQPRVSMFDRVFDQFRWGEKVRPGDIVVVNIQNVEDYMASFGTGETGREWHDEDFPNIVAPFPWMWTEYDNGGGRDGFDVGVLMSTCDPPEAANPNIRWPAGSVGVVADLYFCAHANHSATLVEGFYFAVDKATGRCVASTYAPLPGAPDDERGQSRTGRFHTTSPLGPEVAHDFLGPTFLAISFMHCKNVAVDARGPDSGLSRAWKKRHGTPLVSWHVLQIDPMKQVLRREGASDVHGLARALHICRGHFATYTSERPMFGSQVGTFWRPMHLRGQASEGAVLKDYRIGAPAMGACVEGSR